MRNRAWDLIEALTCAIALFLLVMWCESAKANGDMPADRGQPLKQLEPQYENVRCNEEASLCIVPLPVLLSSEELKARMLKEINALRRENNTLREAKDCGKLEVVPKLKKEREL